jgi:hypothetical protein
MAGARALPCILQISERPALARDNTGQTEPTWQWHASAAATIRAHNLDAHPALADPHTTPARGGETMPHLRRLAVWIALLAIVLAEIVRDARNY